MFFWYRNIKVRDISQFAFINTKLSFGLIDIFQPYGINFPQKMYFYKKKVMFKLRYLVYNGNTHANHFYF